MFQLFAEIGEENAVNVVTNTTSKYEKDCQKSK